jgi:transposase-like protein
LPAATEEDLQFLGLAPQYLETYRLAHFHTPPLKRAEIARRQGVKPITIKRHLALVDRKLAEPEALKSPGTRQGPAHRSVTDPDTYAKAIAQLSDPQRNIAGIARSLGLAPDAAAKIAYELDTHFQPLKRELEDVRVEELTKAFGTLTRDALAAITDDKLRASSARDLGVLAGIGSQNFQLLRGQPTSRMEISDRRNMNEVLKLMYAEAKRRGFEIDVTPDGTTSVVGERNIHPEPHEKLVAKVKTKDPEGTLAPA